MQAFLLMGYPSSDYSNTRILTLTSETHPWQSWDG
jgi:hypothetical protein